MAASKSVSAPKPAAAHAVTPVVANGKTQVHGVFSTQEIRKVGTGTTTRKTVQKNFWFVEQQGDVIQCQPLNPNYVPSGPKRTITMDELLTKFAPEPEFYLNAVFPKMMELQRSVENGDNHREKGDTFTAEFEYDHALKIDEENVRANFGIGLTYLERGDTARAQDIFERLVKLDGAFEPEHKHLFNEFGINLRKNHMLEQSLAYYRRALELTKNDENLYMNMARVQLEVQDLNSCIDNLMEALRLAPRHEPSLKFLAWLIQKQMVPADRVDDVRAALLAATQPAAPQASGQGTEQNAEQDAAPADATPPTPSVATPSAPQTSPAPQGAGPQS